MKKLCGRQNKNARILYPRLKLRDIAERLHCRLDGTAGDLEIVRVAGIEQAGPGDLTFIANPKYRPLLGATRASAVILPSDFEGDAPCAVLRSDNPYLSFAQVVDLLVQAPPPGPGIDPLASIAADALVGPDVSIGPFVTIGSGASIGARTIIYPNVVIGPRARLGEACVVHSHASIRDGVSIGDRVVLQDGVVVGSDGFGFVKQPDGSHLKIPQHADVVIEDDVEIGANTTIDRPAVGETRIRAGAKIDNLVQIAHGVQIGRRALLAAQVGIAGSTVLEDDVVLAGQVGVSGHVRLGQGVVATAQSGIPNSIEPGSLVSGYPAIPNRDWLKSSAVFRQLPAMKKRLAELEARIAELEEMLSKCQTRPDR
jgi:UDP-3-O-[3-hydroxymyristoyl] glucosamine N-acyltransferase